VFRQDFELLGNGKQSADAIADDYTAFTGVFVGYGQSGIFRCLEAGGDGKLGEPVHALCLFSVHICIDVKALYLAPDFDIELGRIEKSNQVDT
jgi:hypothetical protein